MTELDEIKDTLWLYSTNERLSQVIAQRAEKYLKQLHLWDRRDDIARSLSGGMKRRLMIARALIHEPKLLILDEPTAGVDIEIRRSMWQFLRDINAAGVTIILTTVAGRASYGVEEGAVGLHRAMHSYHAKAQGMVHRKGR